MTTSNEDFDRLMYADALVMVDGLRGIKGVLRGRVLRAARNRTYHWLNEGVRDEEQLRTLVLADVNEEFGSIILIMILGGVISFVVQRILERLFPKPDVSTDANLHRSADGGGDA